MSYTRIIPIHSRINPIPRIDTYFFNIYSNIVYLRQDLPKGLFADTNLNAVSWKSNHLVTGQLCH